MEDSSEIPDYSDFDLSCFNEVTRRCINCPGWSKESRNKIIEYNIEFNQRFPQTSCETPKIEKKRKTS